MKGSASLLVMVVAATACSSTGGATGSSTEPVSWPVGEYDLEATVEYRDDNVGGSSTGREDFFAVLVIAPGGSLTLQYVQGICRDPTRREVERDEALRRKTFYCGDTYVIQPAGSTVRGELTATVTEQVRVRVCLRYNDSGVCQTYGWNVSNRTTRKQARLRVTPRN